MAAKKMGNSIFRTEREAGVDSTLGDLRVKTTSDEFDLSSLYIAPALSKALTPIDTSGYFPAGRVRENHPDAYAHGDIEDIAFAKVEF